MVILYICFQFYDIIVRNMTELISLIAIVSASKVAEPLRMILERDGCSYSNKLKIEMKNKINEAALSLELSRVRKSRTLDHTM